MWTSLVISPNGNGATVTFHGELTNGTDATDEDSVLDEQEVCGYKVTIAWYEGKDSEFRKHGGA